MTSWIPVTAETVFPSGDVLVVYTPAPRRGPRIDWREGPMVTMPAVVVMARAHAGKLMTIDNTFTYERDGVVSHWMPLPDVPEVLDA